MFFTNGIKNNGSTTAVRGMPFKPNTMTQGNTFSQNRSIFAHAIVNTRNQPNIKNKKYLQTPISSSQRIQLLKSKAIGKSSMKQGLPADATMSFRSQDTQYRNSSLARCRGGGCVAPAKKGAIANTFKSGGGSNVV
jgi:hypothetical protein